jgi:hypothetical protein
MASNASLEALRTRRPVTMWTSARQTAFIDDISVSIRLKHGRVFNRGEIVTAIIEAVIRSGCDMVEAKNEADVARIALAAFREEKPAGSV